MELPSHYLTVPPCPYKNDKGPTQRRIMFADYGTYQNVNVEVDQASHTVKFLPQKCQKSIPDLSQMAPSIPLHDQPLADKWIASDQILGYANFREIVLKMKSFVKEFSLVKGRIKNNEKEAASMEVCMKTLQGMNKDKRSFDDGLAILRDNLNPRIYSLHEKLLDIGKAYNVNCMSGYNRDYYGGLLANIGEVGNSHETLVHVTGTNFDNICVSSVSTCSNSGLKSMHVTHSRPLDHVFQISSSNKKDEKVLICARESNRCRLLSLSNRLALHPEASSSPLKDPLSSVCFSPYMNNEILMSCQNGGAYLWDINKGVNPFREAPKRQKSNVLEPWSGSQFGGHPRQIIVADNTAVTMFDHRAKFQNGLNIFSMPNPWTKGEEQVMGTLSLGFPHHVVATDCSLFLLDLRMPDSPVLNWSTEMINPPQYIQCVQTEAEADKMILVASQQPAEVMCYPVSSVRGQPLTTPSLPWRASPIGEFSRAHTAFEETLSKRFEFSLAGLAVSCSSSDQGFTVYQLDACGDIFYQTFTPRTSDLNSVGGNSSHNLDSRLSQGFHTSSKAEKLVVHERGKQWLTALEALRKSHNKSHIGDTMGVAVQTDPTLVSEIFSCKPSTTEILEFQQSKKDQVKCVNPFKPHRKLTDFRKLPQKKSNTKLLLALKDGDDITEILKKREAKHQKQRLKMRSSVLRQRREKAKAERGQPERKRQRLQQSEKRATPRKRTVLTSHKLASNSGGKISSTKKSNKLNTSLSSLSSISSNSCHSSDDNSVDQDTADFDSQPMDTELDIPVLDQHEAASCTPKVKRELEVKVEQSELQERQDEPQVTAQHNVISWLLYSVHGGKGSSKRKSGQQTEDDEGSSLTARRSLQFGSECVAEGNDADLPGLTLADIVTNTNVGKTPSDLASLCSSQREVTLARPDLRRHVDPTLAGFLLSPKHRQIKEEDI